jgi:GT2 family glycosyltransferase
VGSYELRIGCGGGLVSRFGLVASRLAQETFRRLHDAACVVACGAVVSSVGIVVVNFNGERFIADCIAALRSTTWPGPIEIVVVDNCSTDRSAEVLILCDANVIVAPTNEGFGAGCNRGIAALPHCDAIALINSDAFVEPGWLDSLVALLDGDANLGAVVPLTLFAGRWQAVEISSPTFVPGSDDGRTLGVQIFDSVGGMLLGIGTHRSETGFRWTSSASATVFVPLGTATLEIVCPNGAVVDGSEVRASLQRQVVDLKLADAVDVVDNAGSRLNSRWWGDEVHHQLPAASVPPTTRNIELWSGGAVLFRRTFLDDVGRFDAPMFLYFEDTDLGLRGRRLGWRYAIEPASIVRHGHGWSSGGAAQPHVRYCTERNRLVVIARHASAGTVARLWAGHALSIGRATARRDLAEARLLGRALVGAVRAMVRGPQPRWRPAKRPRRFQVDDSWSGWGTPDRA